MFRLFGSPYTSGFHQCLTYLRLKQRYPYKLYCSSYLSTILYATFYKSRTMGVQTPALLNGIRREKENSSPSTHTSSPLSHEKNSTETMGISSPPPTTFSIPLGAGHTVCHVWDLEELVEGYEEREQRVYQRLQEMYTEAIRRKVHVQDIHTSASEVVSKRPHGEEVHRSSTHPQTTVGRSGDDGGGGGGGRAATPPHSQGREDDADDPRTLFLSSPKAPPGVAPTPPSSSSSSSSSRIQIPFHTLFPDIPSPSDVPPPPSSQRLRLNRHTHPRLYQLQWAMSLYTYWWLGKTSLLYRFVLSESHEVIAGLLYYFLMMPAGGRAMTHMVAPFAKKAIGGPLASTGVCEATSPYMVAHFQLLVRYLEAHFAFQAEEDAAAAEALAMQEVHWEEVQQVEWTAQRRGHVVNGRRRMEEVNPENPPPPPPPIGFGKARGMERNIADDIRLRPRFLLGTPHPLLCDVLLGAVFASVFLMDDAPASFLRGAGAGEDHVDPSRSYPYLVDYVQRVTGWRGDWLPEENGPTSSAAPSTPSSSSSSHDAWTSFPDRIPERLLGVLELIEEVLPFLLSQVASLQAFMADAKEGWLQLTPYTVDGGLWEGCKGRILPALSPLESLMMVDDCLLTVRSRAFDLELALRAGQALWEHQQEKEGEEEDGDHHHEENIDTKACPTIAHSPSSTPSSSSSSSVSDADSSNGDRPLPFHPTKPVSSTAHRVFTLDATDDLLRPWNPDRQEPILSHPFASSSTEEGNHAMEMEKTIGRHKAELESTTKAIAVEKKNMAAAVGEACPSSKGKAPEEEDDGVVQLEEADFYRAFTNSIRHRERVLKRKAAVEAAVQAAEERARGSSFVPHPSHHHHAGNTMSTSTHQSSAAHSSLSLVSDRERHPSIDDRLRRVLHRVTGMIRQMHCPNYRIATVPYKRRYVSVILPEHEACRARERRKQEDQYAEEQAMQEILRKTSLSKAEE